MRSQRKAAILLLTLILIYANLTIAQHAHPTIAIPAAGNSWIINDVHHTSTVVSADGITNWTNPEHIIRTFFYLDTPGKISLGLNARVDSGTSALKIVFGNTSDFITLTNTEFMMVHLGNFAIDSRDYFFVDIQGMRKDAATFASISELVVEGADSGAVKYVKDDFYFGRRGPSTHLVYEPPDGVDNIEWFYSEIEIADGQDVIGSYFMANGFREGYFGIQVNSSTERRILFSIWSPYKTDNPNEIPDDQKIKLLKKGTGVYAGEFGNEGSGGQSYKIYNWKTNKRYGFLVGAQPQKNNSTNFSAYFFDPDSGAWSLIASFNRPKTATYLKGLYAFLENFIPDTGVLPRQGGYFNPWVRDTNETWHEITHARFSADATARKNARLDYSGGLQKGGFYLKNCGFTNDWTEIGTVFIRDKMHVEPMINFETLE